MAWTVQNKILNKLLKVFLAVLFAAARVVVLLGVALMGLQGVVLLMDSRPEDPERFFGFLLLGLVVAGEIGMYRCKNWWAKAGVAFLFLLSVGAALTAEESCARRSDLCVIHEYNIQNYLKGRTLDSVDFSPPATLQDAVRYFMETDRPVNDLGCPLEIVVEAQHDTCKTRPLPVVAARHISLYDAIRLVAERAGFKMEICDKQVVLKER